VAEPIRSYTPQRDVREELRHKVETAPIDHAGAVLAAYDLLQEAQDHGVLDTLRGAIGAGEAFVSKASEYANTPEGIRLMRNLLAMTRILGELDPAVLDAAAKILSQHYGKDSEPPSLWQTFQRMTSRDSRRTLGMVAELSEVVGRAQNAKEPTRSSYSTVPVPVIALGLGAILASFWIGRRS
jgi:uncharacterized protein YjgD (DUF1641 family)